MLILQKLPQGHPYPQITQAPISNYADFLNFFRGGHTVDDNLGATVIAASPSKRGNGGGRYIWLAGCGH
jgi:hypothetical protein